MGRGSPRLPSFSVKRVMARVRIRPPPAEPKIVSSITPKADRRPAKFSTNGEEKRCDGAQQESAVSRRIMIVVDPAVEAKTALQWALSHTLQNHDTVVLLSVVKPCKHAGEESSEREMNPRGYELLHSLKKVCQTKKPEVHVEVCQVKGKEKGATIVEEARKQEISLLVLGQKKRSMTWRLLLAWAGSRISGGVIEHCIQNADCMALAVRRKSRKLGGYLITTKCHRDFWLLA